MRKLVLGNEEIDAEEKLNSYSCLGSILENEPPWNGDSTRDDKFALGGLHRESLFSLTLER